VVQPLAFSSSSGCADSIENHVECPAITLVTALNTKNSKQIELFHRLQRSIDMYLAPGAAHSWILILSSSSNVLMTEYLSNLSTEIRQIFELDLEPKLSTENFINSTTRFDEYSADGIYRRRRKRIVQMILKLSVAKIVKTANYLILDADCVLLRPATACDFNNLYGSAVVAWSPDFAQSPGEKLRVIGQYGKWIRWSGQVLGLESVDASSGFYGVTPAVLRTGLTLDLLEFLAKRYKCHDWWTKAPAFFTEYGLYFLYAQVTNRLKSEHIRCDGQLYSASLWQDTPRELLDVDLLFRRQSYTLFAVLQSIRSDTNTKDLFFSRNNQNDRVSPAESKQLVINHWTYLEANTDRSLDDRRACEGRSTAFHALTTLITRREQLGPACLTAESIRQFFSSREAILPFFTESATSVASILTECFQTKARRLNPPRNYAEEFALINLFGMIDFDKIIFFAPGTLATPTSPSLFNRPSLSALRKQASSFFDTCVLVIVPDLRLNYFPLLSKLSKRHRHKSNETSLVKFMNEEAFPKWHRHQLPDLFYLPTKSIS